MIEKFGQLQLPFFTPPFESLWEMGTRARCNIMNILGNVVRSDLAERTENINEFARVWRQHMKLGVKDITTGEVEIFLVQIAKSSLSTKPGAQLTKNWWCRYIGQCFVYQTSVQLHGLSFEIGLDESICARFVAKQDSIAGKSGSNVPTTYEQAVSEMPLLDSFITEMWRMHPAVPAFTGEIAKDVVELGRFLPTDSKNSSTLQPRNVMPISIPTPLKSLLIDS